MKPPVSYYGGKQSMVKHLLTMIPPHKLYTEPFLGGGALFWSKKPSPAEVINDLDDNIVNFYRVLQTNFDELYSMVHSTLHSRSHHTAAKYVLKEEPKKIKKSHTYYLGPDGSISTPTQRAWSFWVQTNMSYSSKKFGGFAYDRSEKTTQAIMNKRDRFKQYYHERLRNVCIECTDAIKVIQSRDTETTFHYCDPPYFNSDCGHYGGYTEQDFEALLQTLSKVKGNFLLSSYPSDVLQKYVDEHGWSMRQFQKPVAVSDKTNKMKTEVLTFNYQRPGWLNFQPR